MPNYCVNKNAQPGSDDHEVHDLASPYGCLPDISNKLELGYFSSCAEAVQAAKQVYSDSNGCYYCAPACHSS
jgi:hypothetical protein